MTTTPARPTVSAAQFLWTRRPRRPHARLAAVSAEENSGTGEGEARPAEAAAPLGLSLTTEQQFVLRHSADRHGRVMAGPGTGKSTTVLALAKRVVEAGRVVKVVTFTRAVTAELLAKVQEEEGIVIEPMTMHAFSLSILMRNSGMSGLPEPLRIPDDWETKDLIHPDLARRVRQQGFPKVDTRMIANLEREMASQWDSLNPNLVLLSDVRPELRNAYIAAWRRHRSAFGYSLFAEMPRAARKVLEDHSDAETGEINLLVIDEYQDLNKSEIELGKALARRGCHILAVGDDDQSIYGFRMADPQGIRQFPADLPGAADYTLSVSQRCGTKILTAARNVIEVAPERPPKPSLVPGSGNLPGEFAYLRFQSEDSERRGVVALIKHMRSHGVAAPEIAVLLRGDFNRQWSDPLRRALIRENIAATDVEAALAPLREPSARKLIALARLAVQPADSLAWMTYLHLTSGVSSDYLAGLTDLAAASRRRFGALISELPEAAPDGLSAVSHNRAKRAIGEVADQLNQLDYEGWAETANGWADWLLEVAVTLGLPSSVDFRARVLAVGAITPQAEGLEHFLDQIEPVSKDLALKTDGVAIMTMARSKGLTFRGTVVMGVEQGIVPSPRALDEDEERRLLYVAMTRAREYCYLTMAASRTGPTARTGSGQAQVSRGRCPFFDDLPIEVLDGASYLKGLVPTNA